MTARVRHDLVVVRPLPRLAEINATYAAACAAYAVSMTAFGRAVRAYLETSA